MTYDPHLYRLLHNGNPGDLEFYKRACPPGSAVLELGCGTGRIALALVKNGVVVTGLENHSGMLDVLQEDAARLSPAERGRLRLVFADMRELDLQSRFDLVIIPYNGLLCLLSEEDVIKCLTLVAYHLKPEGELIFDVYDVPYPDRREDDDEDDDFEHIATLDDRGSAIHVFERSVPHADPRRFDTTYRHIVVDELGHERIEVHTIEQRCLYKEDIETLLRRAGLELVSMTSDFTERPVDDDTGQVVVRARRDHR
jgi:SAM-dependent methyltransferase